MKITKQRLKEIIKEELSSILKEDETPALSKEQWVALLNNILEKKNLTTEPEASPRNVEKVATALANAGLGPNHFNQSIVGSNYLDRQTLAKAGWPLRGGGSGDVATTVAAVLMGPR
jgi:hypothetical protein